MINGNDSKKQLVRYAGLAMQFLVSIGICVFIGLKADEWLHISIPLFIWLLPLLSIAGIMYSILKDTEKKK